MRTIAIAVIFWVSGFFFGLGVANNVAKNWRIR
jgi:hypothetical protein